VPPLAVVAKARRGRDGKRAHADKYFAPDRDILYWPRGAKDKASEEVRFNPISIRF